MKVAIVADKKAGHLSQCLGLRELLKIKKKDVFILGKDLFFYQVSLKKFITLFQKNFTYLS